MACTDTPQICRSQGIGLNQNLGLHQTGAGGHFHQAGDFAHLRVRALADSSSASGLSLLSTMVRSLPSPEAPWLWKLMRAPGMVWKHLAGRRSNSRWDDPLVLGLEQTKA
jgi:hypothetical protein